MEKMSEIKYVRQQRLDKLWKHLLELERATGGKLNEEPRDDFDQCPIENFAPDEDADGFLFDYVGSSGNVYYWSNTYQIYDWKDSHWWNSLSEAEQDSITEWVMKKIKERDEKGN